MPRRTLSRVIGRSVTRVPVASKTAFATAAPDAGDPHLAGSEHAHGHRRVGVVEDVDRDVGDVGVRRARGSRPGDALMIRPVRGSISVSSVSARPEPMTMPPLQLAGDGLGVEHAPHVERPDPPRPPGPRRCPRSTCTSQKWAPDAARTQRRWSRNVWAMNRTCPAMARIPRVGTDRHLDVVVPGRAAQGVGRGARRPGRPTGGPPAPDLGSPQSAMLPATLADCADPPAPGAIGRSVSPYSTRTASRGRRARRRRSAPARWPCPCPSRGSRSAAGRCRRRRAAA